MANRSIKFPDSTAFHVLKACVSESVDDFAWKMGSFWPLDHFGGTVYFTNEKTAHRIR
jgi:hypothetical protein